MRINQSLFFLPSVLLSISTKSITDVLMYSHITLTKSHNLAKIAYNEKKLQKMKKQLPYPPP